MLDNLKISSLPKLLCDFFYNLFEVNVVSKILLNLFIRHWFKLVDDFFYKKL